MAETKIGGGLKWVKDELSESLQRVRNQIEPFVASGGKTECAEAVAALNEMRGVLLTLQMNAAARLTEEMQRSLGQMLDDRLPNSDEEAEALVLALVRLPHYLKQVDAGRTESALTLLPSINDLRASRGARPLSAVELVAPSSVLAEFETPTPEALTALATVAAKVRPHFHRYLLLAFQRDGETGLRALGRLFNQLHKLFRHGACCDAFRAAEAMTKGVLDAAIPMTPAAKAALGHIDSLFKPLLQAEPVWPEVQARGLIGQLLMLLAELDSNSALVQELDAKYRPTPPVPDTTGTPPANSRMALAAEAMATLNTEVQRELAVIKDDFDLFFRGGGTAPERLAPMAARLHQLASTIAIGEDAGPPMRLRSLADSLGRVVGGDMPGDEAFCLNFAQELLSLEDTLRKAFPGDNPTPSESDARLVALREAHIELGKAREAIADYALELGDLRRLHNATDILPGVAAALRMVDEGRAAEVLDGVVAVLRQRVTGEPGHSPQTGNLEWLAQAIAGIEMHMESRSQGAPFGEDVLAKAHSAVCTLAGNMPAGVSVPAAFGPEAVPWQGATTWTPAVGRRPFRAAAEPTPEQVATRREAGPPMAMRPVSHVHPEFLEAFLEEAREEHARIAQALGRDDSEALAVLQRSFHTLNGSGRLVGATGIADLAAITETLLNRVLGGALGVTPAVMGYLADAAALVPALIEAEANAGFIDIAPQLAAATELLDAAATAITYNQGPS